MNPQAKSIVGHVQPSIVSRIAQAIMFGRFSGRTPVVSFTAYLDASGTKRMPVLTVAGFVAHAKRWNRFDAKWKSIIDSYQVGAMHMTDFASSKGEFKAWKGQTERRVLFMSELVECIKQETKLGFANSVIVEDYDKIDREFLLREETGSPYALCARTCLGELKRWGDRRKYKPADILVVIEEGDLDRGNFMSRAREDGYSAVSQPKNEVYAFQAADIIAWKSRIALGEALKDSFESVESLREIIRSLNPIRPVTQRISVFDEVALRYMCIKGQVAKRSKAKVAS